MLVQQYLGVQSSNSILFSKSTFHQTAKRTLLDSGIPQKPVVSILHLLSKFGGGIVHLDFQNTIRKFSREIVAYVWVGRVISDEEIYNPTITFRYPQHLVQYISA